MPPGFALMLCLLWCAFVLLQEGRKNPDVSKGLWLPTLWIMRCASRGVDAWMMGWGEDIYLENRLFDQLFIGGLIVSGLVVLFRRRIDWGRMVHGNVFIFAFYAFLVISILWSIAPETTALKFVRSIGDLIMALVVVTEKKPTTALITMARRCMILLIPLSLVFIKYFPEMGRFPAKHWGPDMWIGVGTHKNTLGQLCFLSGITLFWCIRETRRKGQTLTKFRFIPILIDLSYVGMLLYLINGGEDSRSFTSIVCLALSVVMLWVMGRFRGKEKKIYKIILIGIAGVCIATLSSELVFGESMVDLVASLLGKDSTLTGRQWLWQDAIRLGMRHPIEGYGYGAFWGNWVYAELDPRVDYGPRQCHNGYIETFVNLGFVGVFLLSMAALTGLRRAIELCRVDFEGGCLRFVFIVAILFLNYTEATFPRGMHLFWFVFLVVAIIYNPLSQLKHAQYSEAHDKKSPENFK
jgi:exopolysaccharide production protein ExoQ